MMKKWLEFVFLSIKKSRYLLVMIFILLCLFGCSNSDETNEGSQKGDSNESSEKDFSLNFSTLLTIETDS